jgi:hypothetical protein
MGVGGMRMGIPEHGEKSGEYEERGYRGGGDEEGVHGMGSMGMRVGNTEIGNMRTWWGIWGRGLWGGDGDGEYGMESMGMRVGNMGNTRAELSRDARTPLKCVEMT